MLSTFLQEYVQAAYGRSDYYGLFYGGGGRLLACQVVGLLTIAAWVIANMMLFFTTFKVGPVSGDLPPIITNNKE